MEPNEPQEGSISGLEGIKSDPGSLDKAGKLRFATPAGGSGADKNAQAALRYNLDLAAAQRAAKERALPITDLSKADLEAAKKVEINTHRKP